MSMYLKELEIAYHPLKRIYEIFVVIVSFLYSVCFFIFGSLFSDCDFICIFCGLGFFGASIFVGFNCLKKENKIVVTEKDIRQEIVSQRDYQIIGKKNLEKINEKWKIFFSDGYLLYMLLIPLLLILMPFICIITLAKYCVPKTSLKRLKIDDITDIQCKQSVCGKIFNYGTIIFIGTHKKRCFSMIQNPQKVCKEIKLFLKLSN